MNKNESLHKLIDASGHVLAHGMNQLTESGRQAVAAELIIKMNPAFGSINASLALKDSEIQLFSIVPERQ